MTDSPIPAPPDPDDPVARRRAVRWTSAVIATASLFLFVFNAGALKNWSASLKPNDVTVALAGVAADWEALIERAGLTTPRVFLHDAWAAARTLTFPQRSGRTGADEPQR